MNRIENIKYNFWFYHISGWLLYSAFYLFPNRYRINYDNSNSVLLFLFILITGFVLTTTVRYFYRYIYRKKLKLLYLIITIILTSSCLGFLIFFQVKLWVHTETFRNSIGDFIKHYDSFIYMNAFLGEVFLLTVPIFVWSVIYFGLKLWFDLEIEKDRLNRAHYLAKEAELKMLRYQINPHFLFNSLNSIQALMYKDVEKADSMLTEFSEFLRYTLQYSSKTYVPIKTEMEIIEKYLYIEKIRFNELLEYDIEIEEVTKNKEILCFLIQPLVENAIKHGMKSCMPEKLILTILVYMEGTWLIIDVNNTGKWKYSEFSDGTGIKNIKDRLKYAYPSKHKFNISKENDCIKVKLQINLDND
ncbi:sensor histidine kinase [Bacteroidota bacterium]